MRLAGIIGIAALAALAGCEDGRDYPALMPTEQVLAQPALPGHAADALRDPDAATGALAARGAALAGRGGGGSVADAATLDRRAAALRTRSKALSQRSLDDACPEDQPDCAALTASE
ncbi:hypothetical protein [Paracoccus aminovorans]|uniref:hypothetical protein n=1 Tax=Paracoccus aminovorans TaxID=34004 RepID=UPI000781715B|nr:hypothetical protein [Paracoccus aminovorans]